MNRSFWIILSVFFLPISALASAWVIPEGDLYIRESVSIYRASGLYLGKVRTPFSSNPAAFTSTELKRTIVTTYLEYGLPNASISVVAPITKAEQFNALGYIAPEQTGIGDVRIDYKRPVWNGFVDVAGSVGVKFPGDYNQLNLNAIGEGQTDILTKLYVSKFLANGLFGGVDVGYEFRDGAPANKTTIYGELGYSTPFRLTPRVFYEWQLSPTGVEIGGAGFVFPGAPSGAPSTDATGFPATRENVNHVGGSLDYSFGKWDVGVTYATVIDGRNTPNGHTTSVSTGYRF